MTSHQQAVTSHQQAASSGQPGVSPVSLPRARRTVTACVWIVAVMSGSGSLLAQQGAGRKVEVVPVVRQTVERRAELVGSVMAWQMTTLRARVSGYVESLAVMPGDVLEAGAVVAQLAVPELASERLAAAARVRSAEAEVADAEANVLGARAAVAVGAASVELRRAELIEAQTRLDVLEQSLKRTRMLEQGRAATAEELELVEGDVAMARARVLSAGAFVRVGEAQLKAAQAGEQAAAAAVDSAHAMVETRQQLVEGLDVQLGFATLTSPFARGVVSARHIDEGALVLAGETAVVTLLDTSRVRVVFDVSDRDAPFISVGATVMVEFGSPAGMVEAQVARTAGSLDPATRTLRVEVDLDNSDDRYLPGTFVRGEVVVVRRNDALVVPGSAVATDGRQHYLLVERDGRAHRVDVELGVDDGIQVEIRTGLAGGERVIVGRPVGVHDGDRVRAVLAGARP